MKVFLTDTAKLDLIDIVDYFDSHAPSIADHFENELQQRLETLREFPRVGHAGFAGLLELGFQDFPYVLSYKVLQDEVQIIAILHTARDREHALAMRQVHQRQIEPSRILRRLQHLREWSHEEIKQVFP